MKRLRILLGEVVLLEGTTVEARGDARALFCCFAREVHEVVEDARADPQDLAARLQGNGEGPKQAP